jgi:intracellular sulfur oxidation DsrE/DsrF family protein
MRPSTRTAALLLATTLLGAAPGALSEPAADAASAQRMVFHVDETRNARWALMLARSYLDDVPGARVTVVTYGPGVDFLLHDAEDRHGNPYDPAVLTLIERGVGFRICGTTLKERGIAREQVLDGVEIVPSGLAEIARLQTVEGYAYLKP